jgi:hypothetical protein
VVIVAGGGHRWYGKQLLQKQRSGLQTEIESGYCAKKIAGAHVASRILCKINAKGRGQMREEEVKKAKLSMEREQ